METKPEPQRSLLIDLISLIGKNAHSGPQWAHESDDLDLTLIRWTRDQGVAAHRNDEVDVVLVVVDGAGEVAVGGSLHRLTAGQALLIPKGVERAIRCTGDTFAYLSIHRRRRGLWPTVKGFS